MKASLRLYVLSLLLLGSGHALAAQTNPNIPNFNIGVEGDFEDGTVGADDIARLQNCILEAKILVNSRQNGETSCRIGIQFDPPVTSEISTSGNLTFPTGKNILDFKAILLGAGGGGGHGRDADNTHRSGEGGKKGFSLTKEFGTLPYDECQIAIGDGGLGGTWTNSTSTINGRTGGQTVLTCNGGTLVAAANGGAGGRGWFHQGGIVEAFPNALDECGTPGEDSSLENDGSVFKKGSYAYCENSRPGGEGLEAGHGAGGGGGASHDDSSARRNGRVGGKGFAKISYKTCTHSDPDGVLTRLNVDPKELGCLKAGTTPNCMPRSWGEWENIGECEFRVDDDGRPIPGPKYISQVRTCLNPPNPCSGMGSCTGSPNRYTQCQGNTPPSTCFVTGTQVTMADGSKKNIEDVKLGEDLIDGQNNIVKVLELKVHDHNGKIFSINGGPYFFTEAHPFLSLDGWKAINPSKGSEEAKVHVTKMRVGDILLKTTGLEVIYSIDSIESEEKVYNFEVSDTHGYVADDYVVHNAK